MKEVCIINYASNAAVYGVGTYIKEYVCCLTNLGYKINLVELGTNDKRAEFYIKENGNIRTLHFPFLHFGDVDSYNKGVCRLLRLYVNDSDNLVFHLHYFHSDSFLDCIKKYFPQSKSVFTIHYLYWSEALQGNVTSFEKIICNIENEKTKKKYGNIIDNYNKEKIFLEKVDRIVCLSDDTLNLIQNHYRIKENTWLIPNGLRKNSRNLSENQKSKIREKFSINSEEKILLFVGRIAPIKGIDKIIACFDVIIKEYPNCRLVVTGQGDLNGIIKKCKKAFSKVTFTGRLDKKTLYQWYQIANIALFPSFYEECSYVGIEMMMHGLPVIASDGYSVKNMFHDRQNARVAKISNQKKPKEYNSNLSTVILELLSSEDLCKQLSKGAKQAFKSCYTSGKMQEGYKKLLESLDR